MAPSTLIIGLRATQSLSALLLLGFSGYLVMWHNDNTLSPSPPSFNFLLASSSISLLAVAVLETLAFSAPSRNTHLLLLKWMTPASGHPSAFTVATATYATTVLEFCLGFAMSLSAFVSVAVYMTDLDYCDASALPCVAGHVVVAFSAVEMVAWALSCFVAVVAATGSAGGATVDITRSPAGGDGGRGRSNGEAGGARPSSSSSSASSSKGSVFSSSSSVKAIVMKKIASKKEMKAAYAAQKAKESQFEV